MGKISMTAGSAVLLLLLTGCDGAPPPVTPAPTPSVTPVFASDEEALAAAEEAYGAYTSTEDAIAHDGGTNVDRLAPLVTPEWLEHERQAFANFNATGRRQLGTTIVSAVQLQRVEQLQNSRAEVTIYVCVDFSSTSFVDATGAPVASGGPATLTLEATLTGANSKLLLSGNEPWSESIC